MWAEHLSDYITFIIVSLQMDYIFIQFFYWECTFERVKFLLNRPKLFKTVTGQSLKRNSSLPKIHQRHAFGNFYHSSGNKINFATSFNFWLETDVWKDRMCKLTKNLKLKVGHNHILRKSNLFPFLLLLNLF